MEQTLDQAVQASTELISTWGIQVVGALAVLAIGWWVAARLRSGARRGLEATGIDVTLVPFFAGAIYYVALAVVVIAVLNLFGIETTSLIAVMGAASLAVGMAIRFSPLSRVSR